MKNLVVKLGAAAQLMFLLNLCACLSAGTGRQQTGTVEEWKQEILKTERSFAQMAKEKGIKEAFATFAAPEAVLMRNNTLFKGKEAVVKLHDNQLYQTAQLSWEPEFVDVSASGDLGYTYGGYVFSFSDSNGTIKEHKGVFHTVWKRQPDGSWRFVWD